MAVLHSVGMPAGRRRMYRPVARLKDRLMTRKSQAIAIARSSDESGDRIRHFLIASVYAASAFAALALALIK